LVTVTFVPTVIVRFVGEKAYPWIVMVLPVPLVEDVAGDERELVLPHAAAARTNTKRVVPTLNLEKGNRGIPERLRQRPSGVRIISQCVVGAWGSVARSR
jgi:hypothetical protein